MYDNLKTAVINEWKIFVFDNTVWTVKSSATLRSPQVSVSRGRMLLGTNYLRYG
jgi:hypothetical protein